MSPVLRHAPRVGFGLLVLALVAFEALFWGERSAALRSLANEAALRDERASDLLHEELIKRLDVAEARIEALESLPLLEEDGLLWVRRGLQLAPRATDQRPATVALDAGRAGEQGSPLRDGALREALAAHLSGASLDTSSFDEGLNTELSRSREAQAALFLAWPWLRRTEAGELCVLAQRLQPKDTALVAACARGLEGRRLNLHASSEPSVVELDSVTWVVVQRGDDLRGVKVDLTDVLARVQVGLERRAMLESGDTLESISSPQLPRARLTSVRLAGADRDARTAFLLKTALLTLMAGLGFAVVLLARLAERREQRTLQLQREFITTMSHELRTPIAAIRVLAETLERKLQGEATAKDYPRRLVSAADGLGFLVENILSFNRIQAGKWELKRAPFEWATLERALRDDAAAMLERPVQVQCEGVSALPGVSADGALLTLLALNLQRNAWKFTVDEAPTFRVSGEVQGREVVVRFTDTGPGIPAAEHERVFDAFHRVEGTANVAGSGLGLALARNIATLHGGTLRISASSSRGTTFELRIPAE